MNRAETMKILTFLAVNYESIDRKIVDNSKRDILVNTWQSCLADTEYPICSKACQKYILQNKFAPTIKDIREEIISIAGGDKEIAIDYWNEAYNMITKGSYMTVEEFDSHSDVCKRYFGNITRLKEKSRTENLNLEVEQSLFNKTAESMKSIKRQNALLPNKLKEQIEMLSGNMDAVKMIGG